LIYEEKSNSRSRRDDLRILCFNRKKAIESTDGTSDVNVNLVTNSATFSYDPDITTISDIQKSVKKAGYSLKLNLEEENKEFKNSKKLLLLSIVFLIPISVLMIFDMFKIFMIPYMDFLETILSNPFNINNWI